MNNISVITAVKNKPIHLFESLESIDELAEEIIIADLGIDEEYRTKLKRMKKVKIISITENAPYIELIREKLKQYSSCEYIFFLDPDEIVPTHLASILKKNLGNADYFKIPRKNIIFGKWIQHARWWPDYQIRLFKKSQVTWPLHIHHQPIPRGKEFAVEPNEELALIHYNYDTIDEYLGKMYRYARVEAQEMVMSGQNFTLRTAFKNGLSEFISRFFADKGYEDGTHGFVLSFLQLFNCMLVYMYYWEMKDKFKTKPEELAQDTQLFFQQGLKETNHWIMKEKLVKSLNILKIKLINKLL